MESASKLDVVRIIAGNARSMCVVGVVRLLFSWFIVVTELQSLSALFKSIVVCQLRDLHSPYS
jgi:hypothetical protein